MDRDFKPNRETPGLSRRMETLVGKPDSLYHGEDVTKSRLKFNIKHMPRPKNKKELRTLSQDSYNKIRGVIEAHTNEELFEKKRYKWTGTTSLGSYLVSATSSHYDWALKLIKKGKK